MNVEPKAEPVIHFARSADAIIATAESCTGGLLAGALTAVPGASKVFDRGFVTYSNVAKTEMLGVSPGLVDAHGAVSEEVARAMAEGALMRSRATVALSITGVAGPGGSDNKPEGRVCFGLASGDGHAMTETMDFGALGRDNVRRLSVAHALVLLAEMLSRTTQD